MKKFLWLIVFGMASARSDGQAPQNFYENTLYDEGYLVTAEILCKTLEETNDFKSLVNLASNKATDKRIEQLIIQGGRGFTHDVRAVGLHNACMIAQVPVNGIIYVREVDQ